MTGLIERAIYKQSDLLLMDEATSHLDVESESTIKNPIHHFETLARNLLGCIVYIHSKSPRRSLSSRRR